MSDSELSGIAASTLMTMTERFDPYPGLRPIGYWSGPDQPFLPDPTQLQDDTWDPKQRSQVAEILASAATHQPGEGCSLCRICGTPNGFLDLSNGTYVWPEGLSHYISEHAVRLPADVIAALLSNTATTDIQVLA